MNLHQQQQQIVLQVTVLKQQQKMRGIPRSSMSKLLYEGKDNDDEGITAFAGKPQFEKYINDAYRKGPTSADTTELHSL
jgi:hypothetical protein